MPQTSGLKVQIGKAEIVAGDGAPTNVQATRGTLYIRTDATTTATRLYINTTGATAWATFTASA